MTLLPEKLPLRWLLPMLVALALSLTLVGVYGLAIHLRLKAEHDDMQQDAMREASRLVLHLAESSLHGGSVQLEMALMQLDPRLTAVWVLDGEDKILFSRNAAGKPALRPDIPAALVRETRSGRLAQWHESVESQQSWVIMAYEPVLELPVGSLRGQDKHLLIVEYDLRQQNELIRQQIRSVLQWPAILLIVLVMLMYWVLQREALRPLARLEQAVKKFGEPGQQADFLVGGSSEIRELGRVLHDMAGKLQQALGQLAEREKLASDLLIQRNSMLQAVPDLLFEMDGEGRYIEVWAGVAGDGLIATREQLLGRNVKELMPAAAAETVIRTLQQALREGRSAGELICLPFDDGERWFELSAAKIDDDHGGHCLVLSRDVSSRQRDTQALLLWRKVFQATHNGILLTNAERIIIDVNPAFSRVTGFSREEVLGRKPSVLASGRHDARFYSEMWVQIAKLGVWQGEIWNRRKDGTIFPEWQSITEIRDEQGDVTHYISVFSDISGQKEAESFIQRLAYYDVLTGLPNRAMLADHAAKALSLCKHEGTTLALAIIDLDQFKHINDSLSHAVGDQLLQLVAQRLEDLLGGKDTVARAGGDEFIVLMPDVSEGEAADWAGKALQSLSEPYQLGGYALVVTASIGVAMAPGDGDILQELLRAADVALFRAKEEGRHTFRFFRPQMQQRTVARLQLDSDLRQAISNDELVLYYQPQCYPDGSLAGVEALVRWRHPQRGLVPPGEFIPFAEESGLIIPLGAWVLDHALQQMVQWQQQGVPVPLVAVNLSAMQFRQADLLEQIATALLKYQLSPGVLELELTESLVLDKPTEALAVMHGLHKLGVHLSIDDFGTGYSSLNYLRHFPVDRLKIDQSFVRDLATGQRGVAIVEAIVRLAQSLEFATIAEGVEDEAQQALLQQLGCTQMQGYLFARPMPAADLEAWLAAR